MLDNNIKFKDVIDNNYYNEIHFLFLKKLLGGLLKRGNKTYALKLVNNLKYIIKKISKKDFNFLFLNTILNSIIKFYFIRKKMGGSIKEIPMPITYKRQIGILMKTLIKLSLSKRTHNPNINNIALLIFLTNRNKGPLIIKKYRAYRKALDSRFLLYLIRK